jgi:hypothetical protein
MAANRGTRAAPGEAGCRDASRNAGHLRHSIAIASRKMTRGEVSDGRKNQLSSIGFTSWPGSQDTRLR